MGADSKKSQETMDAMLIEAILGLWLVASLALVVVVARAVGRADEESDLAALCRDVRRADADARERAAPPPERRPWGR